jgi:hypothetical protein
VESANLLDVLIIHHEGKPDAAVKLLPCDHEVIDSSPGNSLLQKCREGCVQKTQSGQIFPRTLNKRELHAPGCSFLLIIHHVHINLPREISC